MQKIKSFLRTDIFFECVLLTFISGLAYLLFVPQFGYFNDDWYLMYAAGAKGTSVFWDIFAIDRPLRALVMIPAYTLFGPNPLYYNLSAFLFRLLGGFVIFVDPSHALAGESPNDTLDGLAVFNLSGLSFPTQCDRLSLSYHRSCRRYVLHCVNDSRQFRQKRDWHGLSFMLFRFCLAGFILVRSNGLSALNFCDLPAY